MTPIEAVVLGVVEGLSEFLPISSTGHLILASALMKLKQTDAHKVFEVTIQSGAMLAVVYIYRKQLASRSDPQGESPSYSLNSGSKTGLQP